MKSLHNELGLSDAEGEAAKAKVNEWVKVENATGPSKIAEWKAKGDAKSLQARADLADDYAEAMSVIASSAVENAAQAALEALLAHYDVEACKVAHPVG